MKQLISILISLILFNACSSHKGMTIEEKNAALRNYITTSQIESVNKVNSFRFYGWNSLTDDFLILSSSPKRKYLIELSGYCADLRWSNAIIVNRSMNSTLHARFDSISTIRTPQMNCIIKTIYPLSIENINQIEAIHKLEPKTSPIEAEKVDKENS